MAQTLTLTPKLYVDCETCGGEGRIWASRYGGNDPDVWDAGRCEACDGEGYVPAEPKRCAYCDEPFAPTDKALTDVHGEPVHLACAECMVEDELSPEARLILRINAVTAAQRAA